MVEPSWHNPQTQPLTVALKNICRDYPAGGGVLRELLQNADDAGASTVKFVLDHKSYPSATLVDTSLADYQGPSLLAYNDSTFTKEDFDSLSRIGESRKLQDGSTTGRFGRGFNAVYNWTDSPSIVSQNHLLILDPHHWWTKPFENSGGAGGAGYDFVKNAQSGLMRDQMAAFSTITKDFDRPFPGTIIRIPLRTPKQAKSSKICTRETHFSDVAQVLQTFADDFGHTGLLFMKNVSRIIIIVGNEPPINICISNDEEVRKHKSEINAVIKKTILEGGNNFDSSFKVEIKSGPRDQERQYLFAIHHSIQNYPEDESLNSWSKDEALIPWVALASEIGASACETTGGSLFNVLPSHIHINQPIHIHSCFSMSPDRARLHQIGDSSVQYPLSGRWNHWLFDELIPTAWTQLLLYLAQEYPDQPAFEVWPRPQEDSNDISYHIDEKVLRIIQHKNYSVWHTDLRYVTLDSGLVADSEKPLAMREALKGAGIPVIYLPDVLLPSVEKTCKLVYLKSSTLCDRLERGREQLRMVGGVAKQTLLDYIISDPEFRGYGAVELFPFEDGNYKAINDKAAFIHRDDDERLLFELDKSCNIELQKLSATTLRVFLKGCSESTLHSSLRHRSACDLKTYCLKTHFQNFDSSKDLICVDKDTRTFISKVWDWVVTRQYSILDNDISCLWILPLTDGRYRKMKPSDASFDTIYPHPGELGDFLKSLTNITASSNKPIIQVDDLSSCSRQLLIDAMKTDLRMFIKSSDSIKDFVLWLGEIRGVFDVATDQDRWDLHKLLASRVTACKDPKSVSNVLRGLRVFQRVFWRAENGQMVLQNTWVTLNEISTPVGLREIDPVPDFGGVTFLNAKSDDTETLLSYFRLAECPSALELMVRFMVPLWEDKTMLSNWTTSGKEKITESLLRNFYNLDELSKRRISSSAIIPVKRSNGEKADKFSMVKELIDPSNVKLRDLFFEDEEVCPLDWVWEKYMGILVDCGLRTTLDNNLVVERVECFAKRTQDVEKTSKRAEKLLSSVLSWEGGFDGREVLAIRELRWLPAVDVHGSRVFKNSQECRGLDANLLVGLVLPILDFEILPGWRNLLGWGELVPPETLVKQLERGIEQENRKIIDAVLNYINRNNQLEAVSQELLKLRCVVASNGRFVSVQMAFQSGCKNLQPYLYNVERHFLIEHGSLLKKLGVKERPNLQDLLRIQDQLPSEHQLDENDISVAIQISKLASIFPRSQISSIKILDGTGRLRAIKDITFNDLGSSAITGVFNSTHPDIPKTIIDALQIEPISARVKKGELGIEDNDDDEFDQHEDVATSISDTLTRYPVESTFKEFLANADDCKDASVLNWLLDEREHPRERLLTQELGKFQGSALLVHNDGVFREDEFRNDFKGLRCVGRGGKKNDPSTIGKFGRGAQTMYHWTDVPMLLSGKWLVILDPLRQVLDLNYNTGRRKPGVKIELSKLKRAYKDQLAPFEGLWGFSQELDYYPGTIFRFPLRQRNEQSKLMETGTPLDFEATRKCLDNFLETDGRISLLFLRSINYMDFRVIGAKQPRWSIQSEKKWSFSGWTYCKITKCMDEKLSCTFQDRWRVAIQDLEKLPSELQYRHEKTMKDVECGIAAFVPDLTLKQTPIFLGDPVPKYFSTLPLRFPTDLPVHVHATFLLGSDRQSMPIEDSTQDDGAKWNRWLLSSAIPYLYLYFLEDLGRETTELPDPFPFWPQDSPSRGHLSEPVYTSFWEVLPNSKCKLFPIASQVKAALIKKRAPPKLLTINEAVFDLLSDSKSSALSGILESQIPTLVRPPKKIRSKLKGVVDKSVTPKRLRQIFKDRKAGKYLEEAASKDPMVLDTSLELIKPVLEGDFMELDGCHVLPLADGTLGTLRLVNSFGQADLYFLATEEDLKLFDFALARLVGEEPGKAFKKTIMDCKKFNITLLDLSNIGKLLERQQFRDQICTADMDSWLVNFWSYCRRNESSELDAKTPFTSRPEIRSHPIFKATCNGINRYIEPEKLDILPSVIEPDLTQQRSLCTKFPGMYMFNSSYLPTHLRASEISLDTPTSFTRFIKSISKLAVKESISLDAYIKRYLHTPEIQLLQKLVVNYVSAAPLLQDKDMKNLLRLLPVWPNTGSSTWISATAARATESSGLLVPWMTGYQNFLDHKTFVSNLSTLRALDVDEVPGSIMLSRHILPNLPTNLLNVDIYRTLIRTIPKISNWRSSLGSLRQSRLAPNRAKLLIPTSQLFDHEDIIFISAFRNEADSVFLLRELEESRAFWLEIGLKHRVNGQFEPADYISCLTKMKERLERGENQSSYPGIITDALEVLKPLTTPSTALDRFSTRDWSVLAGQATFPAMTRLDNQPLHRRERMDLLADYTPLLQLSDVVGSQYMSICWSQVPFPAVEPTAPTLAELNSKGKPPTAMVWKHLKHLAGSIDRIEESSVAAFLSDLYNTYDYLQDNLGDSRESFTALHESKVWFNLEVTDNELVRKADLESCRCGIENLILESSCDTTNLKSVRQGLIRYQKLLRALGCKSILYPSVETQQTYTNQLVSTSLSRLRHDRILLDLTLEAESGSIRAHKVVMAAASGFFARQFKDHWSNHDIIDLKPFTYSTMSTVVDFAYADAFDWKSMQLQDSDYNKGNTIADKLDDLLDLLEAANYLDMPGLKAQVENQILVLPRLFIREHNVLGVLKRVSDAKAARVERYCNKFYADNKEAVDLATETNTIE